MPESIFAALITGLLTFAGVWLTNRKSNAVLYTRLEAKIDRNQAVTDTKIDELAREVRAHNGHGERIIALEEKAKAADRRLTDLEHR